MYHLFITFKNFIYADANVFTGNVRIISRRGNKTFQIFLQYYINIKKRYSWCSCSSIFNKLEFHFNLMDDKARVCHRILSHGGLERINNCRNPARFTCPNGVCENLHPHTLKICISICKARLLVGSRYCRAFLRIDNIIMYIRVSMKTL